MVRPVNSEIGVNQDISERDDLRPRHLGIAGPHIFGDSRRCFTNHGELLDYGAAEQFRFLKALEFDPSDELSNVLRRFQYVRQIERLMPHTGGAPLRARRTESAV